MPPRTRPQKPEGLVVDLRCYSREAVLQAAGVFARRADFFVEDESRTSLALSVRARAALSPEESRRLAGEFLNEALNQDLRLEVVKSRQDLLRLLTAQVLGAAAGDAGQSGVDAKKELELRRQAEAFMAEAGGGAASKRRGGAR